jgi:hypothetical protein
MYCFHHRLTIHSCQPQPSQVRNEGVPAYILRPSPTRFIPRLGLADTLPSDPRRTPSTCHSNATCNRFDDAFTYERSKGRPCTSPLLVSRLMTYLLFGPEIYACMLRVLSRRPAQRHRPTWRSFSERSARPLCNGGQGPFSHTAEPVIAQRPQNPKKKSLTIRKNIRQPRLQIYMWPN